MARRYPNTTQVAVKLNDDDLDALDRLVDALPRDPNRSEAIRRAIRAVPPRVVADEASGAAWLALDGDVAAQLAELANRFGTTTDTVVVALLNDPNHRAIVKRNLAEIALTS